jgi:regulator of RNase E activity RraA
MTLTASDLEALTAFDTPTICNALELIEPSRRGYGYTRRSMVAVNAGSGPVVGLARTATMRSAIRAEHDSDRLKHERLKYYEYVHDGDGLPKVAVMQDLDGDEAGTGPFWGEFNTRIHRAMGVRAIVTDGSIRDVAKLPSDILLLSRGLRPSHAFVHITHFGSQVNIFGMSVCHDEVVHADEHGAVAFPRQLVDEVAERAAEFVASEAPIIEACKADALSLDELKRLYMAR